MKLSKIIMPWDESLITPALDKAVADGAFITLSGTTGCGITRFCQDYAARKAAAFRAVVVDVFPQPQSIILLKTLREFLAPGSVPSNWRMFSIGMMVRSLGVHLATSGTECLFLDHGLDVGYEDIAILRRVQEDVARRARQCAFVLTGADDLVDRSENLHGVNSVIDTFLRVPPLTTDDCIGILAEWVPAAGELQRLYNKQNAGAIRLADKIFLTAGVSIRALERLAKHWLDQSPATALPVTLVEDFAGRYLPCEPEEGENEACVEGE